LEHKSCLFETDVREANFVASAAALDFVTVIPCVPEHMTIAKLVVLRIKKMIVFHTIIIAENSNNYNS
jgi:hypothetical protein